MCSAMSSSLESVIRPLMPAFADEILGAWNGQAGVAGRVGERDLEADPPKLDEPRRPRLPRSAASLTAAPAGGGAWAGAVDGGADGQVGVGETPLLQAMARQAAAQRGGADRTFLHPMSPVVQVRAVIKACRSSMKKLRPRRGDRCHPPRIGRGLTQEVSRGKWEAGLGLAAIQRTSVLDKVRSQTAWVSSS